MTKEAIVQTWNLADLYASPDDPQLQTDLKTSDILLEQLATYRSTLATLSSTDLLALIIIWEKLAFSFHKIGLYAHLLESTHLGEPEITRFSKKIDETLIKKGKEIIFLEVELSQLSEEQWQSHLNAPVLQPYRTFLHDLYLEAKHTLSEPEEKILAEKSQTSGMALTHLFKITTSTLTFPWEDKQLTTDEMITKLHDPNPEIRKKVAFVLHEGLQTNARTTPTIYNALVQDKAISDTLRHYDYPEERRFQNDSVDQTTVTALLTAIEQKSSLLERYYTLKKDILGLDTVYWWDRYAPLPKPKKHIAINEAKVIIDTTFRAFSPQVADIAQTMIQKAHIDWMPSPTKQGGAFCAMTGGTIYPYVLLNYTNELNDVMTLAHELGHAVHDVLAQQDNVFLQSHASLALAEIASTFAESLVFDQLLTQLPNREDQIALLMSAVEDNISTVFRQASMFRFEQQIHALRKEKGELSKEEIDDLWDTIMTKPYGSSVIFTPEHKNFWMYIPHIINTPFYVYSYAFAQLCTLALVQEYKTHGQVFVPTYLNILKAGGSLSPKDNLAQAGLDIAKPDFWHKGLTVVEQYIDQLEKLVAPA